MTFNNILRNPTLSGWTLAKVVQDNAGNTKHIEYPTDWEQVSWPQMEGDPNAIPASYHRDQGFGLAAGFIRWRGGYVQRDVPLKRGQRYLAKATFHVNMSFHEGAPPPGWRSHIEWSFQLDLGQGLIVETHMGTSAHSSFGGEETFLVVMESQADMPADFGLIFTSRYPSTQGEVLVKRIELLEVPPDYGDSVLSLAAPGSAASDSLAERSAMEAAVEAGRQAVASHADALAPHMTNEDLDVMIAGFSSAARFLGTREEVSAAFDRLAMVLQRLKDARG